MLQLGLECLEDWQEWASALGCLWERKEWVWGSALGCLLERQGWVLGSAMGFLWEKRKSAPQRHPLAVQRRQLDRRVQWGLEEAELGCLWERKEWVWGSALGCQQEKRESAPQRHPLAVLR